ncbi:MAG: hypothetical protein ACOCXY_03410 [Planctomycetota bacterium]
MSRGLGKVQRMCLDVLSRQESTLDSIEIAGRALDKSEINDSEHVSFRRALRKLADRGLVVDMGRSFHDRRRRWALPDVAKRYFERVELVFGKQMAAEAKAKSSFTADRFPDDA